MDHLAHDEKSLRTHPRPFFVRPEDEGLDLAESSILSPTIYISREKLLEAIDHAERLTSWLQERIEEHRARKWAQRQTT